MNAKKQGWTLGPWKATCNHISAVIKTVNGDTLYPTIALVDTTTTASNANARLIAAAPEMVEALQLIMGYEGESHPHVVSCVRIARAALAATEGRGDE